MKLVQLGDKKALYFGPDPDDPRPGMALRGWANLSLKVNGSTIKGRCPFCGAKVRAKVRRGKVHNLVWHHEPWCPVPRG